MSNLDIREELKAYLDGELSQARADEVRAAIENDPMLKAEVEFMQSLNRSFESLTRGPAAPAMKPIPQGRTWLRLGPGLALGAASILVVATSLTLIKRGSFGDPAFAPRGTDSTREMEAIPAPPVSRPTEGGAAGRDRGSASGEFAPAPGDAANALEEQKQTAGESGDRTIIRRGELIVRVDLLEDAVRKSEDYVKQVRGFVESSILSESAHRPSANLTVRVPVNRFDEVMVELASFGTRLSRHVDGEDVTTQIVDMDARLKTLRAQEQSYRRILGEAKNVGEVLKVEDQLAEIRTRIEVLEAQRKSTMSLAALATINIQFVQSAQADAAANDEGWAGEAWGRAMSRLANFGKSIATGAIYLFAFAPVWLPILFVAWLLVRVTSRSAAA